MAAATIVSWRASAVAIASRSASHNGVEPSMSVKRKVCSVVAGGVVARAARAGPASDRIVGEDGGLDGPQVGTRIDPDLFDQHGTGSL